jgi:hypothetical protein
MLGSDIGSALTTIFSSLIIDISYIVIDTADNGGFVSGVRQR